MVLGQIIVSALSTVYDKGAAALSIVSNNGAVARSGGFSYDKRTLCKATCKYWLKDGTLQLRHFGYHKVHAELTQLSAQTRGGTLAAEFCRHKCKVLVGVKTLFFQGG